MSCLLNCRPYEQKHSRHARHNLSRLSRHSRTVGCQNAVDFVIKVLTWCDAVLLSVNSVCVWVKINHRWRQSLQLVLADAAWVDLNNCTLRTVLLTGGGHSINICSDNPGNNRRLIQLYSPCWGCILCCCYIRLLIYKGVPVVFPFELLLRIKLNFRLYYDRQQ